VDDRGRREGPQSARREVRVVRPWGRSSEGGMVDVKVDPIGVTGLLRA